LATLPRPDANQRLTIVLDEPGGGIGLIPIVDSTGRIITVVGAGDSVIGRVKITNGTDVVDASTPYFDSDGDNTAQTIKNSAGYLASLVVTNPNAAEAWIQLFDESGAISVGTTTPKQSFPIPADDGTNSGVFGIVFEGVFGMRFSNTIKYACTTTATGSGDPTVGLVVNAGYR